MQIKDIFEKRIDRPIQGVIKVGQDEQENMKQELEEYVITRELKRHFRDFFANYKKGANDNTDKMGVWISGFFGSGKSHFLKILSYLLENREVDGKKALDYFIDDNKIDDPMVLADMELACNIPTDVVLFNIDSKSKSSGTKGKDSILNVFLRVFNEMQGFSSDPHVADLERQLKNDGLYDEYKKTYLELHNMEWIDNRHKFKFHRDKVIKALAHIGFMSEEGARDWTRETIKSYEISIDRFAEMVKEYLDSKEEDHHIVFLVDEIGQYIGNDTDLMLNLQTITEDLGIACQGKAWIVVTSQQDIDSITEVVGDDFSKIQGRFDTRLNLTSANVDEVIKLRILEKKEVARQTLNVEYETKETIIKNLLIFDDGIEKKLYENKENFSNVYPFVPYQFDLLAHTLTSIRSHGASGKHLSEGERSMLALFKESAEGIKAKEIGELIPFNVFYDGLEKFLDHSHSAVISRALDNRSINPNREEDNFTVNVLKTLFLIKYLKEIVANLENITTLMVSNIDDDRIELKDRVEKSLNVLVKQTLVQKNGDIYVFLTDEEQEVNREIGRQIIEPQAVTKEISEMIYAGMLADGRVNSDKFGNRYIFDFNRFIDGEPYRSSQSAHIGVEIKTPLSAKEGIDTELRLKSQDSNIVYVNLTEDRGFLEEIRTMLKIERYLRLADTSNIPKVEEIKNLKRSELSEHKKRSENLLEEALIECDIYFNGDKVEKVGQDFAYNIMETLKKAIDNVYHRLNYMDMAVENTDIQRLFKNRKSKNIQLDTLGKSNENAVKEVLDYIMIRTQSYSKISLKEIKDHFSKPPYGFLDQDIEWIISRIFIEGKISFILNGEPISFLNESDDMIIEYITKKQYADKLLVEEKEIIDERYIKSLKRVSLELFNRDIISEDTDRMIRDFNEAASNMFDELEQLYERYSKANYPGNEIIKTGKEIMLRTEGLSGSSEIFEEIYESEDDYLDFGEDYEPVKQFYEGDQKVIWDKTQELIKIYNDSKSYILDEDIEGIISSMEDILKMINPYNNIKKLPSLNNKFSEKYNELLNGILKPIEETIDSNWKRVLKELETTGFEDKFKDEFLSSFNDLKDKARSSNNIANINSYELESDTLKMRYLRVIENEIEKINKAKEKEELEKEEIGEKLEKAKETVKEKPRKKRRNLSIRDMNISNSWQIETKEDLDEYISDLKKELENKLEDGTILNIEF